MNDQESTVNVEYESNYILTPDGTFLNTAGGGNAQQDNSKDKTDNKSGSDQKAPDVLITSLRLLNTKTGKIWDQRIADVREGYEEVYYSLIGSGEQKRFQGNENIAGPGPHEFSKTGLFYDIVFNGGYEEYKGLIFEFTGGSVTPKPATQSKILPNGSVITANVTTVGLWWKVISPLPAPEVTVVWGCTVTEIVTTVK